MICRRPASIAPPETALGLRARLQRGFSWNLLATVATQGSTFVANVVVARLLGPAEFGEYAIVQGTLLPIAVMANLATGYTATKYVAEYRSTDRERAGRIAALCGLVSVATALLATAVCIALSPWLAAHVLRAPHLTPALVVGCLYLLCASVNGFQMGLLAGLERYRSLMSAAVPSGLLTIGGIAVGTWYFGLLGAVTGLSATAAVRCLVFQVWVWVDLRREGIRLRFDHLGWERSVLIRFALPAATASLYTLPAIWLANLVLVRQPGGYEQLGYYTAANNIRVIALFIPNILNTVSLSILNNLKGQGDLARYHRLFRTSVYAMAGLAFLAAVVLASCGRLVIGLFGERFVTQASLLWPLLLGATLEATSTAVYQFVQSHERMWQSVLKINVPREALFVGLTFALAPGYGAWGMALAYLAACLYSLASHVAIARGIWRQEYALTEATCR